MCSFFVVVIGCLFFFQSFASCVFNLIIVSQNITDLLLLYLKNYFFEIFFVSLSFSFFSQIIIAIVLTHVVSLGYQDEASFVHHGLKSFRLLAAG